jgi:hypothetical protein
MANPTPSTTLAAEKRHHVDDDERADEIGMIDRDRHRQRPAEAVADDDRAIEMPVANVGRELLAHSPDQRLRNRRSAHETGQRQHVAFITIAITRDGRRPRVGRRGKPWNQNHRTPASDDVDVERMVRILVGPREP